MNNADVYHESLSSHRHYDNLSQIAVTSLVAVIGATPVAYEKVSAMAWGGLVFLGGAALVWLIWLIYDRFDMHAAVALRCAQYYEESATATERGVKVDGNVLHGFAHGFSNKMLFPELSRIRGGGFVHAQLGKVARVAMAVFVFAGTFILTTRVMAFWN